MAVGIAGYLAILALFWFAQERLMFYPRPADRVPPPPPGWRLEEIRHRAADGTVLAGVLLLPPVARAPLVIYYGGNAEEVTSYAPLVPEAYGARAVLLVNYRGYGASGGRPGERELVADAVEIFDAMAKRPDIDPSRIAVHGRSLGSGVAVQVAAARPARCVVLTSPFASARDVASSLYPWLPVRLLMRHPFDSARHAPKLRMPALVLMGEADTLIPRAHSERLADLWAGPVQRVAIPGFGHNDVSLGPGYSSALLAFLERCH
ncbi:MAG TPA: alpha/beta hydrolase [Usitatibacter sp.]|nr:alpha/beta hydrolase [Usitatibacter sp.]